MQEIDGFVICLAEEWKLYVQAIVVELGITKNVLFSQPGEARQITIYNALKTLELYGLGNDDVVVIHDAARPLVSQKLIRRCIEGCKKADGILPCVPVKDTLYHSTDGRSIASLLKRSEIVAGQAPETFVFGKYLEVHERMNYNDIFQISGSTEIAYKMGLNVNLVKGEENNFKITTCEDLERFKSILNK
jgi:2-C-methyl-D-erythritol 4-phosphate cytidylyltransferase